MERRFVLFWVLVCLLLALHMTLQTLFFPPQNPPAQVAQQGAEKGKAGEKAGEKAAQPKPEKPAGQQAAAEKPSAEKPEGEKPAAPEKEPAKEKPAAEAPAAAEAPEPAIAPQWLTLGSADPAKPYRMLVTLTNVGAAIERAELNSPRYKDIDNRSGYLGYLAGADAPQAAGCLVRVVGPGTPAAAAGLKPGDVIESLGDKRLFSAADLDEWLNKTQPGQSLELTLQGGRKLQAQLVRRPLSIVRPEWDSKPVEVVQPGDHDPFSLLVTLEQAGQQTLKDSEEELPGVHLRSEPWEVVAARETECSFRKKLSALHLEVTKHYRLAQVAPAESDLQPAYHLEFALEVKNLAEQPQEVAYRLDGPTGVVLEGAWYASKISRNWGGGGLRDVDAKFKPQGGFGGGALAEVGCNTIAAGDAKPWPTVPLQYAAVDAQYFSVALIPDEEFADQFASVTPLLAGAVPKDKGDYKLTDVSFRLVSQNTTIGPGDTLAHRFKLFLGPKQPGLLANYGPPGAPLTALVYYGWPIWAAVAEIMLAVLHSLYHVVHNYGLAIVLLTVLVRGSMFPLSRKQAIGAQKMQELQPQLKALAEKYKKDPQAKQQATQELFRKHNYNPLGGCLLMFIQLPIFMGLYRSLMVDVELRQAPLISDAMRWCSNLAAPDMLYNWTSFMPEFVTKGSGFMGLGPYLNLFPLVTIALFIWQQKMFMPPATDEQTAMQQKMMQYMMIFMGIMFFKVASGLCLYFIASSIWGITERKLLHPPAQPAGGSAVSSPPVERSEPGGNGRSGGGGKRRERGRR